jgi:hypothetical protein
MEPSAYRKAADRWWTAKPADIYLTYIQNRLLRYDRVNEQIRANHIDDAILQLLPIWNNELFFEAHDHLERIWSRAVGEKREALKGLIKAAGVYIHLEYKRKKAVASLAAKSLDIIRRHSEALTFITNLDVLKEKLKNLDPVPPRLENPALR